MPVAFLDVSFLVEVEKTDIEQVEEQYPDAFKKDHDPASGPIFSAGLKV
jgi:hypothetical protein